MKRILVIIACTFFIVATGCESTNQIATTGERKDIPGITGKLTLHPDSISLEGNDGKLYFFFFVSNKKALFITSNEKMYPSFSRYLPEIIVEERWIELEGTSIDPFTLFSAEQLEKESQRIGIQLNEYKIYKIFNYGKFVKNKEVVSYENSSPRRENNQSPVQEENSKPRWDRKK